MTCAAHSTSMLEVHQESRSHELIVPHRTDRLLLIQQAMKSGKNQNGHNSYKHCIVHNRSAVQTQHLLSSCVNCYVSFSPCATYPNCNASLDLCGLYLLRGGRGPKAVQAKNGQRLQTTRRSSRSSWRWWGTGPRSSRGPRPCPCSCSFRYTGR